MRIFARDWVESFAVVMLSLTTVVSYFNENYGTAVVAGTCAGFIGGMQIAKWVYRTR